MQHSSYRLLLLYAWLCLMLVKRLYCVKLHGKHSYMMFGLLKDGSSAHLCVIHLNCG